MTAYLLVFVAAAATTFALTPAVRAVVVRLGWIVEPADRRVHRTPTPTMGGVAMYLGFLVALGLSRFLPFFREVNAASPEPLAALVACTLMVALGIVDDTRGIRALTKLTAQIFIGGILVLLGGILVYMWFPGGGRIGQVVVLANDQGAILTIAWVVIVANAVNLIDGLDGLAAGMVAIAAGGFFFYMVRSPSLFGDASQAALLSAITAGVCVGFLPWNFHPAKIFMGDTGSMLLGMLLAMTTISGVGRNPYQPSGGDLAAIVGTVAVPLLVLAIPFLDVAMAVIRRTWRGQSVGHADKEHLHHRLMDAGHGHRKAVLLLYLWSALLSGAGLAVGLINGRLAVGLILIAALALFLVTALPAISSKRLGNGDSAVKADEHAAGR
ncbi:MAG: MraY family glycosyltransferase [Actinomycetota bacterium]